MDQVSDGLGENMMSSLTSDGPVVNSAGGSGETTTTSSARRSRRNRRDRHKRPTMATPDSTAVIQLMDADLSQPPPSLLYLADPHQSIGGRTHKSSAISSSSASSVTSSLSGKEQMSSKGSGTMDPAKLASFSIGPPLPSSVTGNYNDYYCYTS